MKRPIALVGSLALMLLPLGAHAQAFVPTVYCGGLPGCQAGVIEYFTPLLTVVLAHFELYVYILGGLFVMIGGAYILLGGANEEYVNKGKSAITWALLGVVVGKFASIIINLVLVPEIASIPAGELVISIVALAVDDILSLLKVALVAMALYSGMRMVLSRGKEEEFAGGRKGLIYALAGALIIQLAQGAINLIAGLFLAP